MVFIDSHCHIDVYSEIAEVVKRAKKKDVKIIINNGVGIETNRKTLKLSENYKEIKAALGMYPTDGVKLTKSQLEDEIDFIRSNERDIIAVGEIGLDLKELPDLKKQQEVFEKMIDLSILIDKPMFIHSRKAERECIGILEAKKAKKVIMHCFSGKLKLVDRIIENDWFLTIPTCVKHAEHFQRIVEKVNINRLLCETDSPWMHPDKLNNNEPANIVEAYKVIAKIKKISLKNVEAQIEKNYKGLFG